MKYLEYRTRQSDPKITPTAHIILFNCDLEMYGEKGPMVLFFLIMNNMKIPQS